MPNIQIKRGLSTALFATNPILVDGEIVFETDTKKFKLGDGSTSWNNLPYAVLPNSGVSISGINIISGSGNFNTLTVSSVPVSVSGHSHTSSNITDFNSSVSGLLPVKNIIAGSGIGVSSDSGAYTISVTGTFGLTSEEVDDRVSNLLVAGTGINLSYNDNSNSLTINLASSVVSGYEVLSSGKSIFTVSQGYLSNNLNVYVNGSKLILGEDYTASNGSTFTLTQTATSGDIIEWQGLGGPAAYAELNHTHSSSDITNFNTSVSGLLPTIANSGDNRILTSTGSSVGINAEANLTFDGSLLNVVGSGSFSSNLNLSSQTVNTIAGFDGSKNIVSLPTSTYPSFTELSYVKGVTSSIQTQLNSKAPTASPAFTGNATIIASSGIPLTLNGNSTALRIEEGSGETIDIYRQVSDGLLYLDANQQTFSGFVFRTTPTGGSVTERLRIKSTGESEFTGSVVVNNSGNVVPLTVTNTGTANSFVVNDQSGDPTPFVIDAGGNVGIKATSTASSLNVVGNSAFYQDANGTPSLGSKNFYCATFENFSSGYGLAIGGVNTSTGSTFIQGQSFVSSVAYDLLLQPLGGNVGIGTINPSMPLHVFSSATSDANKATIMLEGTVGTSQSFAGIRFKHNVYTTGWGADILAIDSPNFNAHLTFRTTSGGANTSSPVERMRITSAGNVGIGTSSPSNRLHVQGGELYKTTTDFVFGTTGSLVSTYHGASTGNTYGAIGALSAGGSAWNNLVLQAGGGNVGIGITNPTEKLHVRGAGARACIYNTTTDAVMTIQGLTPASPWFGAGKSAVQIDVDGWGGFAWQTDVTSGAKLFKLINNGGYGASESTFITINNSGNVLVGTQGGGLGVSTPLYLQLGNQFSNTAGDAAKSKLRFFEDSSGNICGFGVSNALFETHAPSGAALATYVGNAERFRISSAGTITAAQVYSDTVGATNRDLFVDSTGKFGYVSSIRASKTNIAAIDDVSWLRDLTPVSFFYRRRNEDGTYSDEPDGTLDYGLIAEDVELVAPELCFYDIVDDNPELRGIHYSKLITPMLKYIQQLEDRIASLETRLGDNV